MRENWLITNKKTSRVTELTEECGISDFEGRLLVNRDVNDIEAIKRFLYGDLEFLYSGESMKGMNEGVEIIYNAIKNNKKIVIYGDYDCDGVTSTVILYKALKVCKANFKYHIPNRENEGYGMNSERIKKLKEEGFEVILTCDNGISACSEIELAKDLGFDVIITDHHDVPFTEENGVKKEVIPKADTVINPKQKDCEYPFKNLCGAGVALKFIQCLYEKMKIEQGKWKELIEFSAIATVCDVVDLLDENRIIVKEGLKALNTTNNLGLRELIKATGLEGKKITAYHLGFVLGPCINATGRLETADLSVELLITEDINRAEELAKELFELNKIRQDLTSESVEQVIEQIEKNNMQEDKVLLVYNDYIHESIAGIVAGRIREKYNVPAIILTKGKTMPKGSGRSIEEYNMFEELLKCKDVIDKFGGHPMAAGLSIKEDNLIKLREMLLENCTLTDKDIIPKVKIDMRLPINYVNENLIKTIEFLEPFGKGNSTPLFGEKGVNIKRIWLLGKDKNVIKFRCKLNDSNAYVDAIAFNKAEVFKEEFINKFGEEYFNEIINTGFCNFNIDFVYVPQINEFNGNRIVQLVIKYLRI